MWISNRFDTNRAVQAQKVARGSFIYLFIYSFSYSFISILFMEICRFDKHLFIYFVSIHPCFVFFLSYSYSPYIPLVSHMQNVSFPMRWLIYLFIYLMSTPICVDVDTDVTVSTLTNDISDMSNVHVDITVDVSLDSLSKSSDWKLNRIKIICIFPNLIFSHVKI